MELIVDVQGFKINSNEIIFKEVAVIDVNESDFPSTYLFKPPFKWDELSSDAQRENIWLYKNYHGLQWDSGHIVYDDLDAVFDEIAGYHEDLKIYVKGQQKKQWLQSYFMNVYNLKDYDCPNLQQCEFTIGGACCLHHHPLNKSFNCAVKNVLALKHWLIWYRSQKRLSLDSNDIDIS